MISGLHVYIYMGTFIYTRTQKEELGTKSNRNLKKKVIVRSCHTIVSWLDSEKVVAAPSTE